MGLHPAQKFETSKAGTPVDKCQDASGVAYPYGTGLARLAVCDGATESAFAREWALILTRSFVHQAPDLATLDQESLSSWLEPCEQQWSQAVPWDRIPWHGRAKTQAGAFSTLLGMTISPVPIHPRVYPWYAVAVGDSCLFVVRDGALALSFPLENADQFNNAPNLVCSNPANNSGIWDRVQQTSGECYTGDLIIMASDAVSQWILKEEEAGKRPWDEFFPLDSLATWNDWVQAHRDMGTLRNDDATLVMIRIK